MNPTKRTCQNCGNPVEQQYCGFCGQSADTHRISAHFIWHDLQHSFFHFDNGIFYTLRQLATRPGGTIRDFLEGKRVKHFKPLALIVVLATFYGLLYHHFIIHISPPHLQVPAGGIGNAFNVMFDLMMNHLAFSSVFIILSASIGSYFVFYRKRFNFAEHLVINTYYMGLVLMAAIFTFPLLYFLQKTGNSSLQNYGYALISLELLLLWWCYAQVFRITGIVKALFQTVQSFLIMTLLANIVILIATAAMLRIK